MKMHMPTLDLAAGFLLFGLAAGPTSAEPTTSTPLTLGEALKITLNNAQPVTAARATISSAKAQHLGVIAAFLPSLSLSDQDQYYHPLQGSTSTVIAGTLVPAKHPFYNNVVNANLGFNLYNGGKDVANYQGNLETLRSAITGLSAALNSSFEQVLGDFEALAADQATVAAQQRIVRLDQEIERLTSLRMARQASSRIDLIQAQQQTLAAETQLSQNRQQAMNDREQLQRAMGYLAPSEDWQVEERLPAAPPVAPGQYPVQQDPAVQSAYAQVLAARQQVAVASAAYWPTVALTGQYNLLGTSSTALDQAFTATQGSNYTMGISVSLPLLPFYNTVSAVDVAQANVETNLSTYQSALASASSRTQSAFQQLQEAQQGIKLAAKSAQLAHANAHLTDARYQAHQSSRIDVDRALVLAEQADLSATTATLALRLAAWKLYRAAHPQQFADTLTAAAAKHPSSDPITE